MREALVYFFLLGLSLGIGPCLATCGPLLISYVAGTGKGVKAGIAAYLLFSLGRIFVYLALGLAVFLFGEFVSSRVFSLASKLIFIAGGVFIALIGALMALGKRLDYKFCNKIQGTLFNKDKKTILLLGLLMGIAPCLPFLSLLSYIGLVSKNWLDSLLFSLSFGLGTTASPLLILAGFTGLIPKIISRGNKFYKVFNIICGIVIAFLGVRLIINNL